MSMPDTVYSQRQNHKATAKERYERFRPLIVWLGLIELGWISFWLLSGNQSSFLFVGAIIFWASAMVVWLGAAAILGMRGFFLERTRYFSNLAGFVLVLIFAVLVFGLAPPFREGLVAAVKSIPDLQLAAIHILRLLAIGTIIKYLHGELPLHFLILGSLTDFVFAISAVAVTFMLADGQPGQSFLIAWHITGSVVFLGAGVSMFFTMPSPLRISHKKPDSSIVFQFPMLLAPNFTVPLFVVAHGIALVKLFTS